MPWFVGGWYMRFFCLWVGYHNIIICAARPVLACCGLGWAGLCKAYHSPACLWSPCGGSQLGISPITSQPTFLRPQGLKCGWS
ncbi:hypothetical protein HOY80DRAFT_987251 [Tuber brumale]|nr:hypothetical protein HOY80DRAFT_987251 [Tuber brumale]